MEKTKRVKIVTGLKCNIQCLFCYYRDSLKAPNRTVDDVRRDLWYAKRHGIRDIDFSGGEPTVHPDLPKMISDAKALGMSTVGIISNGWRLSDRKYLRALRDAGLDEILFSVHGSNAGTHDGLTNIAGSYQRMSDALSHAVAEGVRVRTNTVVTKLNVDDLAKISSFVLAFRPVQVNFITINDWCFAKNLVDKLMMPYSEMSPALKKCCDILEGRVTAVNVRYIPFCMMQGYERFVANHAQVPYDRYEWTPHVRARLELGTSIWRYLGILGYGFLLGGAWRGAFRMPYYELLDSCITEALRSWYYTKGNQCQACSRDRICDGVENTYAREYGLAELRAVDGALITHPMGFRSKDAPAGVSSSCRNGSVQ